jgi:putative MATE family efflux protein
MSANNDFLGTEPVGKLLRKLAIPTVAAQVINMLYNIVDRIYIGHMPVNGDLALTGVGVCLPIIMVVSAFASLVASGGAPKASICMGKGDYDQATRIMNSCLALQLLLSAVLTGVLLIWNRPFLLAFGASENTIDYAVDYMNIYALGTVFVQLTLGMNAFITGQGNAKTGMYTVLIGAVCNIILDPIFIFACNMGVRGAALATVLSQAVSCTWVLLFLSGKKSVLRFKRREIRLNMRLLLPCMALGLAPFIMTASESVISVCFNASLLRYGGDPAVGAMTILTSVMQFAMLPLQGLAQGAQPIISYNFGAHKPQRVKKTFFLLLKVSLAFSCILWALVMAAPDLFARVFTNVPTLIAFTAKAIRRYFAVLFVFGAQMACQMTFISIGGAKESIAIAVMRKFILLLPLIYIMPALFPADKAMAVYMAEPVADFLSVAFAVTLFSIQFKKALKKISDPLPAPLDEKHA